MSHSPLSILRANVDMKGNLRRRLYAFKIFFGYPWNNVQQLTVVRNDTE